jgi:alkylation response protein AidB-like acyl-CoA dehydrogenase
MAIYVGAGQQALDFTVDFRKTQRFEPDPESGSHKLVVQQPVAEMSMTESARVVLYQPASRWADADAVQRTVLAARAARLATRAATAHHARSAGRPRPERLPPRSARAG